MSHYRNLIRKNKEKGILLDTGPLLLLVVGFYEQFYELNYIERFCDRIKKFKATKKDYNTLLAILDKFDKKITTPHILTETNNLLGRASENIKPVLLGILSNFIKDNEEKYELSKIIVEKDFFTSYGITDSFIIEDAKDKYLVLTMDFGLAGKLEKMKADVINFTNFQWDI